MNFNKFVNSDYLKSNPLCGISTYKDELNLATGACTRKIKKLVFDGTENWNGYSLSASGVGAILNLPDMLNNGRHNGYCTHFAAQYSPNASANNGITFGASNTTIYITFSTATATALNLTDITSIKTWVAQQYANSTPVTVWYVLATSTTETITVPSGLSGTEEGYLNQSGTPTPTNPIYPTANTVEKWFDINHYIMGTSTDTITTPADIYVNAATATVGLKGNMSQSGIPTPTTPIQPQECGDLETEGTKAGQYKIPISSAGQTTPIYLGEVETTRRVKKLVLDGTEEWEIAGNYGGSNAYFRIGEFVIAQEGNVVCTHYASPDTNISVNNTVQGVKIQSSIVFTRVLIVRPPEFAVWSLDDFKAYLAQQYAAGTPVTVWYVLATETTGIVNEPLRKIGDYADEVSGITIPTTTGKDTFDVLTTLKPSEVELTYTGWHDAQCKEWDGSEWQ